MRWHWHPPPFSLTSTGQYSNNLLYFASDHHFLNLPLRSLDDRQHEWMRTQDPYSRMWVEIENWFELLREFSFFPKLTHSIPSVPLCHKVPVWWHVFTFLSYYFYIAWHKQKKKKLSHMQVVRYCFQCHWSGCYTSGIIDLFPKYESIWLTFTWQILKCH